MEEGYYWIRVSYFQRESWEIGYWDNHRRVIDQNDELDPNRILEIGPKIEPPQTDG